MDSWEYEESVCWCERIILQRRSSYVKDARPAMMFLYLSALGRTPLWQCWLENWQVRNSFSAIWCDLRQIRILGSTKLACTPTIVLLLLKSLRAHAFVYNESKLHDKNYSGEDSSFYVRKLFFESNFTICVLTIHLIRWLPPPNDSNLPRKNWPATKLLMILSMYGPHLC